MEAVSNGSVAHARLDEKLFLDVFSPTPKPKPSTNAKKR
jgi:hypothetical protein